MDGAMTFDEVPALYHRVRPRYPDVLFDIVRGLPGLAAGSRVLEIGSGTGIATGPLLERGFDVTAIEPGAGLTDVARTELEGYPDIRWLETRFEEWPVPEDPFDVVFSATAFHWLDRRIRVGKAAAALRTGGYLAIGSYLHVAGGDTAFFHAIQACYVAHMPGARSDERLLPADQIRPATTELTRGGQFEEPIVHRWVIEETYDRSGYFDLLSTYSGHRLLDHDRRAALFACIGEQIDRLPGKRVRKAYLHELIVARKA
jgi:SAM-dependent methyltransferase